MRLQAKRRGQTPGNRTMNRLPPRGRDCLARPTISRRPQRASKAESVGAASATQHTGKSDAPTAAPSSRHRVLLHTDHAVPAPPPPPLHRLITRTAASYVIAPPFGLPHSLLSLTPSLSFQAFLKAIPQSSAEVHLFVHILCRSLQSFAFAPRISLSKYRKRDTPCPHRETSVAPLSASASLCPLSRLSSHARP